jgi:hypothetical protein
MQMARTLWWLDGSDARLRLDPGGALVGRSTRCDVVLRDPHASRSQAIVYVDDGRPKLLILGKGRTTVNGAAIDGEAKLGDGDCVGFPGLELRVSSSIAGSDEVTAAWVLGRPGGGLVALSHTPFVIGGDPANDLCVEQWPEQALTLHLAQGRLVVVAQVPLEVDGAAVGKGGMVALSPGSEIVHMGQSLRVIAGGEFGDASTLVSGPGDATLPNRVELEFLPRGGRLRVHAAGKRYELYLPGHRCDLMAVLLQPPEPLRPGDVLSDDLVISRVWPVQPRTRIHLNMLIYRLRRDLVRAGIDATSFVLRTEGGGGTKIALAEDADVHVA